MLRKKLFIIIFLLFILITPIFSNVPTTRIHQPNVPYFLESMQFQTIQMLIFPSRISGFVVDPYSDLIWNPAYILSQSQKSVYLDFNAQGTPSAYSVPVFSPYNTYDLVLPRWYSQSSMNRVQTSPHYNFAAIVPLSSKITIGFMNRSIFDYGPFRSIGNYYWRDYGAWGSNSDENYIPQRLEIDENQQTVMGTQSEMIIGYQLSNRVDMGFRLGHYIYDREGNLFDSKWAIYPHSSLADLNDESFNIDGDHIETGIGLLFHLGEKTRLGFYGGFMSGNSSEKIASMDTTDTWYERDSDTTYYQIDYFFLDSRESYSCTGKRPDLSITYERDISSKLMFRSFFSYTWSNKDVSGSFASSDTTYSDGTYDYWQSGTNYFRRTESHSSRESELNGSGKTRMNLWKWFASLIYKPKRNWAVFSGIQIQKYSYEKELEETSSYSSHGWTEYSIYQSETYRNYYSHQKNYSYKLNYEQWSAFIPIGIKAKVYKGLFIILGTDVMLTLTDKNSEGKLLYPRKITRKWENGALIVEDEEINRYEEFNSDPAKEFSRSLAHRFGIMYKHKSGAQLYFRAFEDVFNTTNWALGFEMNW